MLVKHDVMVEFLHWQQGCAVLECMVKGCNTPNPLVGEKKEERELGIGVCLVVVGSSQKSDENFARL